jgi:hypothetical protein
MSDCSLTHRFVQTRVRPFNSIAALRNTRNHNVGTPVVTDHP